MFTGGVKFYQVYICCVTAVVVACVIFIYSWFLSMWWVLSLSILFTPGVEWARYKERDARFAAGLRAASLILGRLLLLY